MTGGSALAPHLDAAFAAARALAEATLAEPAPDWPAAVAHTHVLADRAWVAAAALEPDRAACGPGCGWCCHQPVELSPVEILSLAVTLESAPGWRGRVAAWNGGRACPFLVEYSCSIHPLRPLKCRGLFQPDPRWCMATFAKIDPPPGGPPIRHQPLAVPRRLHEAVAAGFNLPLHAAGLDCDAYSLVPALQSVLDRPDALAAWARGERVFPADAQLHRWVPPGEEAARRA